MSKGLVPATWLTITLALTACESKSKKASGAASTSASAVATTAQTATASQSAASSRPPSTAWVVPKGPRMAILRGEGVGPIRFGATFATVERLMQGPCDEKAEDVCRYPGSALEFRMKDGVVSEVRIYRPKRPSKEHTWGIFNGRFRDGAAFGMHQHIVVEMLGKPDRVEKVKDGGPAGTTEIHYYDGMRLEYDKLPNGNSILGAVILTPWKNPPPKAAAEKKPAPLKMPH